MTLAEIARVLEGNNITAHVLEKKEEVLPFIKKMLPAGATIDYGGSMTLEECGVCDYLNTIKEGSDFYFTSTNAITEDGALYNVDGFANRVSAIAYGPKNVVFVAGKNKLVKNLDAAVMRVKTIAAPKNCVRLNKNTPCAKSGKCISLSKPNPVMCDGCDSPDCICRQYLVTKKPFWQDREHSKNRITVILVNENLGY